MGAAEAQTDRQPPPINHSAAAERERESKSERARDQNWHLTNFLFNILIHKRVSEKNIYGTRTHNIMYIIIFIELIKYSY